MVPEEVAGEQAWRTATFQELFPCTSPREISSASCLLCRWVPALPRSSGHGPHDSELFPRLWGSGFRSPALPVPPRSTACAVLGRLALEQTMQAGRVCPFPHLGLCCRIYSGRPSLSVGLFLKIFFSYLKMLLHLFIFIHLLWRLFAATEDNL